MTARARRRTAVGACAKVMRRLLALAVCLFAPAAASQAAQECPLPVRVTVPYTWQGSGTSLCWAASLRMVMERLNPPPEQVPRLCALVTDQLRSAERLGAGESCCTGGPVNGPQAEQVTLECDMAWWPEPSVHGLSCEVASAFLSTEQATAWLYGDDCTASPFIAIGRAHTVVVTGVQRGDEKDERPGELYLLAVDPLGGAGYEALPQGALVTGEATALQNRVRAVYDIGRAKTECKVEPR